MKSKNYKVSPGWSFPVSNYFEDGEGNSLPIKSSAYSVSISKYNDEPAKVHVETARTTPQGIVRHKKNFEIDRKYRMKRKPVHKNHVTFKLDHPEEESEPSEVEDMRDEINDELKESIDGYDGSEPDADEAEEDIDELTRKLKKRGFSKQKIDMVKKVVLNLLE